MVELKKSINARRNIIWGIVNKLISILLPFVNRTIFLYVLGVELLGLNSLFVSMLQMLNLAEMGFSNAVVYSMYRPIAENNKQMICALLAFYRKIYRVIGVVIFIAGVFVMPLLPYLLQGEPPKGISIYIAYFLYLISTVVSYWCYGYKTAIPNAFQRTDIVNNISSFTTALQSSIQIGLLYVLPNYYLYIMIVSLTNLLNNVLLARVVGYYYPEYICEGTVPREIKKDIGRKVIGLFISKVCGTTRNALDSICLSAFVGLSITAIYNNYLYVIIAMTSIFGVIVSSIVAGVGNSMVIYDSQKNYEDMRKMNFIYMLLSGWGAITLFCLYQPFMEIWTGTDLMLSQWIVALLVIYFYLLRMGDIRFAYSEAAGLWWETRYRAIAESLTNIVLNIVLGMWFGITGIVLATIISLFFINFCWGSQIVFRYYFKNNKIMQYFKDHLRYAIVTIIVGIITFQVCNMELGSVWLNFGARLMICLLLPIVLYFSIWYWSREYQVSARWILMRLNLIKKLKVLVRD